MDGAVGRGEPGEEGVGPAEKEHVGIEHEPVAVMADVSIGEFAKVKVGAALGAERGESRDGQRGVEERFAFGGPADERAGKQPLRLGNQRVIESAVVDEAGAHAVTAVLEQGPHTEGGLVPEAAAREKPDLGRGPAGIGARGKLGGGAAHRGLAPVVEPLVPRPAGAPGTRQGGARTVPGEVGETTETEATGEFAAPGVSRQRGEIGGHGAGRVARRRPNSASLSVRQAA